MNRYFTNIKTSPVQRAVFTAIILVVVNGLLYVPPVYRMIGADKVLLTNNLFNMATALISVWLGFLLWRSVKRGEILGWIWGSLTIGLILWTIAEVIWDSYQFTLPTKLPHTSPADIAWMLGYFAVIFGFILRLYTFRIRLSKPWQFGVIAAFIVLSILVTVYMIIPILNYTRTGISYEKFVGLFYMVGDLALAFLSLLLVLVLEGGLLSKPWIAIAWACFCIATSDLLYALAIWRGIYQVDPIAGLGLLSLVINLSYTLAYVLMALGLYLQANLQGAI